MRKFYSDYEQKSSYFFELFNRLCYYKYMNLIRRNDNE